MKAILVDEPKKIKIIEREIPKIKNNDDILVKIKAVGICGSDVHIYHGTSPVATYPRVVGHEMVGEVIEIGSSVKNIKIGDKVVIEPMIACNECYACKSGRPNACANLKVRGCHVDGGFQEYFVAPEKAVFKFNDNIPWEVAAMIEPYTIGDQITWRADIRPGDFVFIIGAGPIGLCCLEMAKLKGGICIISDLNEKRLGIAKEIGADYIINPSNEDPVKRIQKITNNMGPNITIDAVCLPQTFEQAVQITSAAGRVMSLGFTTEPSKIAQLWITLKELDVRGSRHQTFKFPHVVQLFNEGKLKAERLISNVFNFKDISKALDLIENKPEEICKIVLKFED